MVADRDGASSVTLNQPAIPRIPRAGRLRSSKRSGGRTWAAGIFDRTLTDAERSGAWAAARLEIDESTIRDMRHGEIGIQLGDLLSLGSVGRAVLRAALASMEAQAPAEARLERVALQVGQLAGELQASVLRATADGELDDSERQSIACHVSELDEVVHATERAARTGR